MMSSTQVLTDDLGEMDQILDMLQGGGVDTVWGRNVLAVMLYRDCILRELDRRGVETGYTTLLQSPTTHEIEAPGYEPPEWLERITT
jgi:hypothetical protein